MHNYLIFSYDIIILLTSVFLGMNLNVFYIGSKAQPIFPSVFVLLNECFANSFCDIFQMKSCRIFAILIMQRLGYYQYSCCSFYF